MRERVAPIRLLIAGVTAAAILTVATIGPTALAGLRGDRAAAAADPTLTVVRSGNGTVTSDPAGIACGADCQQSYATSTTVRLAAAPGGLDRFLGWTGACQGDGACSLDMSGDRQVGAQFTGQSPTPTPSPNPTPTPAPTPTPQATATPSPSPGSTLLRVLSARAVQSIARRAELRLRVGCRKACVVRASATLFTLRAPVGPTGPTGPTGASGAAVASVARAAAATKSFRLSIVRRTLGAGKAATLRLKLGRKARAAVRRTATRKRPAIASVRFVTRPKAGGAATVTKRRVSVIP